MFTQQVDKMMADLVTAGMDQRQAQVLQQYLGKCTQALRHDGPISLFLEKPPTAKKSFAPLMSHAEKGTTGLWTNANAVIGGDIEIDGNIISKNGGYQSLMVVLNAGMSGQQVTGNAYTRVNGADTLVAANITFIDRDNRWPLAASGDTGIAIKFGNDFNYVVLVELNTPDMYEGTLNSDWNGGGSIPSITINGNSYGMAAPFAPDSGKKFPSGTTVLVRWIPRDNAFRACEIYACQQ